MYLCKQGTDHGQPRETDMKLTPTFKARMPGRCASSSLIRCTAGWVSVSAALRPTNGLAPKFPLTTRAVAHKARLKFMNSSA